MNTAAPAKPSQHVLRRATTAARCFVPVVAMAGCTPLEPCVPSLEPGHTLQLDVLERYHEDGSFEHPYPDEPPSCGDLADLSPGNTHALQLRDFRQSMVCKTLACPDDFPTPSEPTEAPSLIPYFGDTFLCQGRGREVTLRDGCAATRAVTIDATGSAPFDAPPVPGQVPPTLVRRYLRATPESCPDLRELFPANVFDPDSGSDVAWCMDSFVVNLSVQR